MKRVLRSSVMLFACVMFMMTLALQFGGSFGCGGGGSGNCDPFLQTGCDEGLSCEQISGGETECVSPVIVRGMVKNLANDAAIANARIVALDANSSPISQVAISDASGNYEMVVYVTRTSDGTPVSQKFTLRADAAGYQTFPGGVRQAIPIDAQVAVLEDTQYVIETSLTEIGLIALASGAGTANLGGMVDLPEDSYGVLVVAEASATEGYSAIADRDGDYRIFNLPPGTYTVKAYTKGVNYTPVSITLASGESGTVNLDINGDATATLTGKVNLVDPGQGGDGTSVILVVESTFDESLVRGETPPGLRAPTPGILPNITGSFTIDGVPTGTYVVLAAFENDYLVRDPNTCTAGTDIIHQAFSSGEDVDLGDEGFKVTGALDVISPGADLPETVSTTNPTFSWKDDSSEENYELIVIDSFGNQVWETVIDGVSGDDPEVTYDVDGTGKDAATPLQSGMYYQFRVTSTKTPGSGPTCEISQTEDLKGVFLVE